MDFQLEQTLEILGRTPATLRTLLAGLADAWTLSNAGDDSWSAHNVVGHLIDGEETDWIARARIILEQGESRPFDPVNRFAHLERYGSWPLNQLLDRFEQLRRENLATIQNMRLTAEQLERRGTHPALGTVTLRQLLATWVVHDFNHVGQVVEVMSRQYDEAVGPWKAFLPILSR
jgi:uncharacterized damage-inducible protein DinB